MTSAEIEKALHSLEQQHEAARASAEHLHSSGYFGPAGIDAFSYRDEKGVMQFNPLCEINARVTMGEVARGLHKKLGGKYSMLRQVRPYHLGTLFDYLTLKDRFGSDWYDPQTQQGIFIASAPRIIADGAETLPKIMLIYIAASTQNELDRLHGVTRK